MSDRSDFRETIDPECLERDEALEHARESSRREFVQLLGAGLLLTVTDGAALGQRRRFGESGGRATIAARRLGHDGTITVMTGKVELGQGARAELTQAAAEELRVGAERVQVIMADTALVPNDGITAGSRKVLRPPSYGATLTAIDLAPAQAMEGVVVVRDGVGCRRQADRLGTQQHQFRRGGHRVALRDPKPVQPVGGQQSPAASRLLACAGGHGQQLRA
jgi:hypothetical protein